MNIMEIDDGVVLDVNVKPNSKQFKLIVDSNEITVFCREAPVKGKVNKELAKELSKVFNAKVEIVSGFTSRTKKILVKGVNVQKINEILNGHTLELPATESNKI